MVQTLEQYILVHRAVKELFLEQMRVIDSHPYENVDDDGHPLVDNKEDTDYETVVVSVQLKLSYSLLKKFHCETDANLQSYENFVVWAT